MIWRDVALAASLCPGALEATLPPRTWWQWLTGRPRLSYEDFVGIWLCRQELVSLHAYIHYLGASFAASMEDVPPELFLAVCDDEATAFDLMVRTNNARSMAKLKSQPAGTQSQRLF